jgi:chemotaxis response regulator CheB
MGRNRTMAKIRVMLVHQAELFREGLGTVLEREPGFEMIYKFTDKTDAIAKVGELQPDVILLDEGKPGCTWWVKATLQIREPPPK